MRYALRMTETKDWYLADTSLHPLEWIDPTSPNETMPGNGDGMPAYESLLTAIGPNLKTEAIATQQHLASLTAMAWSVRNATRRQATLSGLTGEAELKDAFQDAPYFNPQLEPMPASLEPTHKAMPSPYRPTDTELAAMAWLNARDAVAALKPATIRISNGSRIARKFAAMRENSKALIQAC